VASKLLQHSAITPSLTYGDIIGGVGGSMPTVSYAALAQERRCKADSIEPNVGLLHRKLRLGRMTPLIAVCRSCPVELKSIQLSVAGVQTNWSPK
jgi:hypothetical protein